MTAQQQLTKRELARIRQQRRRQKNPESERKRQTLHAFVYDAVQPISSFFRGKHQTVAILGKQQLVAILGFSTKYSSPATPSSSITEASAVLKFSDATGFCGWPMSEKTMGMEAQKSATLWSDETHSGGEATPIPWQQAYLRAVCE